MTLSRLISNELVKIFGKWRSYLGFIALGVLLPLVLWGISLGGGEIEKNTISRLEDNFIVLGSIFNGFLATYIVMNFLWVHVPFLIALVAGDVVAGEGASGTLRIYLTRPVSRSRVLAAKLLAAYIYTLMIVLFFALMSLGLGSLWLGTGDLIVRHQGILILPQSVAWARFGLAFLFAAVIMVVVATLCFMFSTMVNNAIGPIIGAMAVIIVGLAIGNLPIAVFEQISPYLFTTYFDIWQLAFHEPIPWGTIMKSLLTLTAYTIGFLAVSFLIFLRKDILS